MYGFNKVLLWLHTGTQHTHTLTHTHKHSQPHTHTNTHSHTHAHTNTKSHTLSLSNTHTHTRTRTLTTTHKYKNVHTHTKTFTNTYTDTQTHSYIQHFVSHEWFQVIPFARCAWLQRSNISSPDEHTESKPQVDLTVVAYIWFHLACFSSFLLMDFMFRVFVLFPFVLKTGNSIS